MFLLLKRNPSEVRKQRELQQAILLTLLALLAAIANLLKPIDRSLLSTLIDITSCNDIIIKITLPDVTVDQ